MNDFISPFILSLKEHQTVNFKTLPYDCIQFSLAVTTEIFMIIKGRKLMIIKSPFKNYSFVTHSYMGTSSLGHLGIL